MPEILSIPLKRSVRILIAYTFICDGRLSLEDIWCWKTFPACLLSFRRLTLRTLCEMDIHDSPIPSLFRFRWYFFVERFMNGHCDMAQNTRSDNTRK